MEEELGYCFKFIANIPSLVILDRYEVTVLERIQANRLFGKGGEGVSFLNRKIKEEEAKGFGVIDEQRRKRLRKVGQSN